MLDRRGCMEDVTFGVLATLMLRKDGQLGRVASSSGM